ncbi:MAG: 1-deoxy-D-xylulose-5-phosphate reductoisomerase, partial [Verrucomicrobia bacterium RIFCSPHIGHO2_12_FULL_41_10]
ITGNAALLPAVAAISSGKMLGIANKEALVSGGEWICSLAKKHGVELIPVDSEHSALHQCLRAGKKSEVRKLILTASGGAFRNKSLEELKNVSLEEALTHPNWTMGPKVKVDCATLMNKGLEMIEARFLFGLDPWQIDAVVHPESLVQSMVEFVDGSLVAQIANPDMALPIQYALTFPERKPGTLSPFDFTRHPTFHFYPPDVKKFPCLQLAFSALKEGRSYPCFLNAANEILVERFMEKEIPFMAIPEKLEKLMTSHRSESVLTLEAILSIDSLARELARKI